MICSTIFRMSYGLTGVIEISNIRYGFLFNRWERIYLDQRKLFTRATLVILVLQILCLLTLKLLGMFHSTCVTCLLCIFIVLHHRLLTSIWIIVVLFSYNSISSIKAYIYTSLLKVPSIFGTQTILRFFRCGCRKNAVVCIS